MPITQTPRGSFHWTDSGESGELPRVILLHGLGGDAGFWAQEIAALSPSFRVLTVDLRGSGLTPGGHAPFSIEDLADDVVAVMDAIGLSAAHVVGFSMGGVVAQALAVRAPDRVRRLVLAGAFATTNVQARLFLEAVASAYASGITPKQMYDLILPWLFSARFLASPEAQPFLSYPEGAPDEQSREDWLHLLHAQLAFDGRARLPEIRHRTLIISGGEDRLATPSDAEALANGIAHSTLATLDGGHLMNVESSAVFIETLSRFLAGND